MAIVYSTYLRFIYWLFHWVNGTTYRWRILRLRVAFYGEKHQIGKVAHDEIQKILKRADECMKETV